MAVSALRIVNVRIGSLNCRDTRVFRLAGGTISISCLVLALSMFEDQARGLDLIFVVFTGVLALSMPLLFLIPEPARPNPYDPSGRRPSASPPAESQPWARTLGSTTVGAY